jgi:hypothetical protein
MISNTKTLAVSTIAIAAVIAVFAATPFVVAHQAQAFGGGNGFIRGGHITHRFGGFGGFRPGFGFPGSGFGGGWGGGWGGGCCGCGGCGGWGGW